MPDFVVDLDLCINGPGEWGLQFAVAVTASNRDAAAMVAMLIASDFEYETDDGTYDRDWRHITIAPKPGHRPN